jgi:hypothetical protein
MTSSLRFSKEGQYSLEHNRREKIAIEQWNEDGHIHEEKICDDVFLIDMDREQFLADLLADSLEKYNQKNEKKHKERCKTLDQLVKENKGKGREGLFQVGKEGEQLTRDEYISICSEFLDKFQEDNPCLHVFHASIHFDETTPHLHFDFFPVSPNAIKVSMEGALRSQGYAKESRKQADAPLIRWTKDTRAEMEKMVDDRLYEWGYEYEYNHIGGTVAERRRHEHYAKYNARKAEEQAKRMRENVNHLNAQLGNLEEEIYNKQQELEELDDEMDRKKKDMDALQVKYDQTEQLYRLVLDQIEDMKEYVEWSREYGRGYEENEILDEKEDRW